MKEEEEEDLLRSRGGVVSSDDGLFELLKFNSSSFPAVSACCWARRETSGTGVSNSQNLRGFARWVLRNVAHMMTSA